MDLPTVLVTGGAARIGAAISRCFADSGWHVLVHSRQASDEVEAFVKSLPSAQSVTCDFSDGVAAVQLIEGLAKTHKDWRVLINSASIFERDSATRLDNELYRRAVQINAASPALMAQSFLANAQSTSGRTVIQITDQKLANPNPDFFSYTMSKHALDATIAMLAMGAAQPADRIYGLAPGAILASHDQSEEETEISHRLNLLRRKTGADEIAQAAHFLAQGFLRSGETLFVDSGQHMLSQPRDVIYLARQSGSTQ